MNTNIKATNIDVSIELEEYINKCVASIGKFINNDQAIIVVEVIKTTNHHKQGDIFKAQFDIRAGDKKFFSVAESDDLMQAVDDAKEAIIREATHLKDRKQTLFKRGASSVKKMMKGLSDRNPFTSKY